VRLVELTVGVTGLARAAQAQQLLALRAELVHLMTLGAVFVSGEIGNPHVALLVHGDAVWSHHHALAEVREHGTRFPIELEDRIEWSVVAVDRTAAGRARAAALIRPDVAVRGIDIDAGRRAPLAASRKLTPTAGHGRGRVRQSLAGDWIRGGRAPGVRCWGLRRGAGVD